MTTLTNIYTDDVQFKSAIPIGFRSKEVYESVSNISICFLDRNDANGYLELETYDCNGIVLAFAPEEDGYQSVTIAPTQYISSKARTMFAQNPNYTKVALIRKDTHAGFGEDEMDATVTMLAKHLTTRGVTVFKDNAQFCLPTPYQELAAVLKSQTVMAALRMDNFIFRNQHIHITNVMPDNFVSNFFNFDIVDESQYNPAKEAENILGKVLDNAVLINPKKETKRGKKRLRESFSNVSVYDLIESGLVSKTAKLRFVVPNQPAGSTVPPVALMPNGLIKVGDEKFSVLSRAGQAVYDSVGKDAVCKSAWKSFEVLTPAGGWKSLEEIRKAYTASLKITGKAGVTAGTPDSRSVSLYDIVKADVLPSKTISLNLRGVKATAEITDAGDILFDGNRYKSPTAAVNAVLEKHIPNFDKPHRDGWNAWYLTDEKDMVRALKYYRDMLA